MSDPLSKEQWLRRVLGVSVPRTAPPAEPPKAVQAAPVPKDVARPSGGGVKIMQGRAPSGEPIVVPPVPKTEPYTVPPGGKTVRVAKKPGGGVVYSAPPPPVREITFSGGGAKGAALPGAVQALQDSGVLKDARKIAGASVGSMTAALVAAGITAEDFKAVANADSTTDVIVEGSGGSALGLLWAATKNLAGSVKDKVTGEGDGRISANPLKGDGLETIVRQVLDETLRKRINGYALECERAGRKPSPDVITVGANLARRGPTFGDLRTLSKHIPAVKEVVITGTYLEEVGTIDAESQEDFENRNDTGQLYVFDADSEPDMEVALAVHASASFPAAFKPVDITLSSGLTVRFIDGGVMNNTPTSSSIGNERELDPMPDGRGMTFVFEDTDGTSKGLQQGQVTAPGQGGTGLLEKAIGKKSLMTGAVDWFVGSEHAGAEYAKNRDMTEHPEEVVEVPLTIEPKQSKWYQRQLLKPWKRREDPDADMRAGTLNFGLSKEAKLKYQAKTEAATQAHIQREQQDKSREFASDSQMFVSIGLPELKGLAAGGYEGAAEAVMFRERVAEMIAKLQAAVKAERAKADSRMARVLEDKDASMALAEFDRLAGDDVDFLGYVARELNKRPELDGVLEAARQGGRSSPAMDAAYAVADTVRTRDHAENILKQIVYPKMKTEANGGAGIETLLVVEGLLRGAVEPDDVNGALRIAIAHFKDKPDHRLPKRGHHEFALQLERRLMH